LARVKCLEIVVPGPLTTVQDRGRFGLGQYGVPPSGAVDPLSLRVGNLLVGNGENEACLEMTFMGPTIMSLRDTTIAVTGGDLQPVVNEKPLQMWRSHLLRRGDILSFKGARSGCRAYLAVGGGISVPVIMGSKSTNLAARFGGLEGRSLRKGDILYSDSTGRHLQTEGIGFDSERWSPLYARNKILRVVPGPHDDHFSPNAQERFFGASFAVTPQSDRTGIRLSGPRIEAKKGLMESILSEGVVPGAIQIPGDAQPIIILVETVTGGYRKMATVISADLHLLGQLKPGDTVRFSSICVKEAYTVAREVEEMIQRFKKETGGA